MRGLPSQSCNEDPVCTSPPPSPPPPQKRNNNTTFTNHSNSKPHVSWRHLISAIIWFVYKLWPRKLHQHILLHIFKHGRKRDSRFCWSFPYGLARWLVTGKGNSGTRHNSGYCSTAPEENLSHSRTKSRVPPNNHRVALRCDGFQNRC